jgi:hypothetical protein
MKRSLVASSFVCAVLGAIGCVEEAPDLSTTNEAPTFEEFVAATHQMEDGTFIVNGDEPIATLEDLEAFYYEVYFGGELIVNRVGGADDKWSTAQVGNLTYCVSTRFGSSHAAIRDAVAQGAAFWEGAASTINFVYVPSADGNCTVRNNAVVFSVEPTNDPSIYARAFFPSYSDRKRNVLVNASLTLNGDFQPRNIMGHELGHTLGFRHEHTRPESGTCFENTSWRALTAYDANSIMHYPNCNGGPGALTWSNLDAAGADALY